MMGSAGKPSAVLRWLACPRCLASAPHRRLRGFALHWRQLRIPPPCTAVPRPQIPDCLPSPALLQPSFDPLAAAAKRAAPPAPKPQASLRNPSTAGSRSSLDTSSPPRQWCTARGRRQARRQAAELRSHRRRRRPSVRWRLQSPRRRRTSWAAPSAAIRGADAHAVAARSSHHGCPLAAPPSAPPRHPQRAATAPRSCRRRGRHVAR